MILNITVNEVEDGDVWMNGEERVKFTLVERGNGVPTGLVRLHGTLDGHRHAWLFPPDMAIEVERG